MRHEACRTKEIATRVHVSCLSWQVSEVEYGEKGYVSACQIKRSKEVRFRINILILLLLTRPLTFVPMYS